MLAAEDDAGVSDSDATTPLLVSNVGQNNDTSSTYDSVSVPSAVQEPANVYKSRWRSIRVMYLVMFLGSVTFTITMSSLWPFLQVLNSKASTSFLGWVVAAYSLGQLVASPFFGGWANLRKNSREPLVISLVLTTLSNVFYMYLESLPSHRDIFMILARGLIGFSAGNVAVVRSYVSGATTVEERTGSMANLSIFQAMGFILGPVIQAALVPIGYPGPVNLVYFHFNMYTAPGFCAAVVASISVFLLIFVFKEHRVYGGHVQAIQSASNNVEDEGNVINANQSDSLTQMQYKLDYVAVCSSIYLFFIVLFIFTVFETIGTPLIMDMYAWDKTKATLYQGIILGVAGCLSIVVFMVVKILAKKYSERCLLLGGFIFCLCGFFTFIPWGSQLPPIGYVSINDTVSSPDAIFTLSLYLINGGQKEALIRISKRDASFEHHKSELMHKFSIQELGYSRNTFHGDSLNISDKSSDSVGLSFQPNGGQRNPNTSSKMTISSFLLVTNFTAEPTASLDITASSSSSIAATKVDFSSTASLIKTNTSLATENRSLTTDNTSLATENPSLTTTENPSLATKDPSLTTTDNTSLTTKDPSLTTNTTSAPNGCPWQFEWCQHVPVIYLSQFLGGTVLISVGYPVCQMLSYALYSKMLGPKPQGLWMGWLTAAGSLARTIGPIYVSQVYDSFGPQVTFGSCCGIIALTIFFYLAMFRRMVPFSFKEESLVQSGGSSVRAAV